MYISIPLRILTITLLLIISYANPPHDKPPDREKVEKRPRFY